MSVLLQGTESPPRPEALAMRLRRTTPAARIVMLAPEGSTPADLRPLGIEVLFPPITVNLLMDRLWRAAA